MPIYSNREAADQIAERIKVFAQGQRLMILNFLLEGEHSVGEIEAATGVGQPALSQQLAELRRAGLVSTRRASKLVYYKLSDPRTISCVEAIRTMFDTNGLSSIEALEINVSNFEADEAVNGAPGSAIFARVGRKSA
jgi:DNA-binding transcriptional ArsR family regulator